MLENMCIQTENQLKFTKTNNIKLYEHKINMNISYSQNNMK